MADNLHNRSRYRNLVAVATRAIDSADPIGLVQMGAPADEYSPEVGTVVPRVSRASSAPEVRRILHEEFVHWFDESAGPEENYASAALEISEAVAAYNRAG